MIRVSFVIVSIIAWCATARAERASTATFEVELAGGSWDSDALATALRADLADDTLRVPAAGAPAELVVLGELRGGELRYTLRRAGIAPVRGAIPVAGLDRPALAGILRDELHRLVRSTAVTPSAPAALPAPRDLGGALAALGGLAALLAVPLAIGAALMRRRAVHLRGMRRVAIAIAGIGGVGYALAAHGDRIPELSGWVFLAGGLAWGGFVAVALPVAMPPLIGLHRVEHAELVRVLVAWLALAIQRTVAVGALVVPIGAVLWLAGDALELTPAITFGVVAPLVAAAVRLGWRAIVEVLATRLDRELVAATVAGDPAGAAPSDRDAAEPGPWHPQLRAYLVGYLHRANLDLDHALLDRIRFLPGREPDVAIYGGGLTHTRVVIPHVMVEHALAPYGRPHDYAMPRVSTLHWTHWNAGLVMPTEAGARLASRADRRPHDTVDEGEHERIALGEPPTLSGIIEPTAFDPRTSYRPAEDPLWLDWDPGEEHDGTDAGDKDYLFGALVDAIGVVERHEDRAATLGLAIRRAAAKQARGRWLARVVARAIAPVQRTAARRAGALGNAHAALNGARHHLAQYLGWLLWQRDDLTTARANGPELEQASRKIIAALDAEAGHTTLAAAGRPAIARRLDQLRPFLTAAAVPRSQRRKLALGFAALVGLGAAAAVVVQAVLYHATYEARITAVHERLDDGTGP